MTNWRKFSPAVAVFAQLSGKRTDRTEISRRLRDFCDSFTERHQRTESEFLKLGAILRSLHSKGTQLAELIGEHLIGLRGTLMENQIGGPDGMAACSLRELHAGMEDASQKLDSLRTVVAELRRLRAQIQVVERVGVLIRSSVFGFTVESARTVEHHSTFESFVEELRALADRIAEVAEGVTLNARLTQSTQERELGEMSEGLARQRRLASSLEATAAATASNAQRLLDVSLAGVQQTSERTRCIARLADDAVYHLQFGDIVRQKSEHVTATLRQTIQQLSGTGSDREFVVQATVADRVLAIQVGHLELIRHEIDNARGRLGETFRRLVRQTGELAEVIGRQDRSADAAESGDALGAFKVDLRRLEALHSQSGSLCIGVRQSARRAAETSKVLTHHVEDLNAVNHAIHLQALNAIVKTAQLGSEGATLAVLSMHIDWLYRESRQGLVEVVGTLRAILHASEESLAGQPDSAGEDASIAQLRKGMERFEAVCDGCNRIRSTATRLAEDQRAMLEGDRLAFLADLSATTELQIEELTSIRHVLRPWVQAVPDLAGEAIDSHVEHYTMQSERHVHRLATEGLGMPPVISSGGEEEKDFGLSPISDGWHFHPKVPSTVTDSQRDPPVPEPSSEEVVHAFGDNVELF